MDNIWDTLRAAAQQIDETDRAIRNQGNVLARLLKGRLRSVDSSWLKDLKRELQEFDSVRGRWKTKR